MLGRGASRGSITTSTFDRTPEADAFGRERTVYSRCHDLEIHQITAYGEDLGSGSTGSCVRMLSGQITVVLPLLYCITTGVERWFCPERGAPGR